MQMTLRSTTTAAVAVAAIVLSAPPVPTAGQSAARRPTAPPIFALDDSAYLRWPPPESMKQYGALDGVAMKNTVAALTAISERSRSDGNQWWGRITGTRYHDETQRWIADRFRALGMDVRLQEFELPDAWYPTAWEMS